MNIIHINTERGWRGGERQTLWLAEALSQRGYNNWLVCRPGFPLWEKAQEKGISVFPLRPFAEFDFMAAHFLNRFIKKVKADIVHAHTGHAVGLGAFAGCGTKAKLVATRRVDFPLQAHFLSRWKYKRVHKVAVLSNAIEHIMQGSGISSEKMVVIPSGIQRQGYPEAASFVSLRKKHGYQAEDIIVINVAALVPHKDQSTLLKAFAHVVKSLPQAQLLVLGEGSLRQNLAKQTHELGLRKNVKWLGYQSDVLDWIAMANLFVMSSSEEGLGTSLLDAMAIGVPTAATKAGGIPDIYGSSDISELSPVGDAMALSKNILSVLTDDVEKKRRISFAQERVQLFTVSRMAEQYESLYKDLLCQR